jgi:hypothetical protein
MNMEIVSIEKKTFEMMVAAFGALSEKVAALRRKSDTGRMERWLTGEEREDRWGVKRARRSAGS